MIYEAVSETVCNFRASRPMAANYHADAQGTGVIYETVSEAICQVRQCSAPLQANWKNRIDDDYKKRGKNR